MKLHRHSATGARQFGIEHLEPRMLLAGLDAHVFATFEGVIEQAGEIDQFAIRISDEEFSLDADAGTLVGFLVKPPRGSGLDAGAVQILDDANTGIVPELRRPDLLGPSESLVLAQLGRGGYQVQVVGQGGTTGAYQLQVFLAGDADGDRDVDQTDEAIVQLARQPVPFDTMVPFGQPGDQPVVGDWDGDGIDDLGVVRGNLWFFDTDNNGGLGERVLLFGKVSDRPVVADVDGDGIDEIGVLRGNLWIFDTGHDGGVGERVVKFGLPGDQPVVGDVDGDGIDELGVVRGNVWIFDTGRDGGVGERVRMYGLPGDTPAMGDFNGDGADEMAVVRGRQWLLDTDGRGGPAEQVIPFAPLGTQPVIGQWNGIGAAELGLYRNGLWFKSGTNHYRIEADADRDGRITSFDVDARTRNVHDRTSVEPMVFDPLATGPGLGRLPDGTPVINQERLPVAGTTVAGLTVTVDVNNGGFQGTAVAGAAGDYHIDAPMLLGHNQVTTRVADIFGQSRTSELDVYRDPGQTFADVGGEVGLQFHGAYGDAWVDDMDWMLRMQRNMGNGAAVGDYDGDGDPDVLLLSNAGHANVLYRNDADGRRRRFVDVTLQVGGTALAAEQALSRTAQFADLDNDGDQDLIVVNEDDGLHVPTQLFRNNGDGTLSDVTAGSGLVVPGHIRAGLAAADYDQDGLLDLYITNWSAELGAPPARFPGSNQLFRNLGGLQFEDVTLNVGLGALTKDSFSAIFSDVTGNGYPDIYVAIDNTYDEFYRNDGGTFVLATDMAQLNHRGNDMGVTAGDFDNDGDLDFYATNISDPKKITDPLHSIGTDYGNVFYVNVTQPGQPVLFEDQAAAYGIQDTYWGWGVKFLDTENDGDLDILAVNGFDEHLLSLAPVGAQLIGTPAVLWVNDGSGNFARQLVPDPGTYSDARALVTFDYDLDGDEDALITNTDGPVWLLENFSAPAGWLDIAVVQGPNGNRDGVGASVRVQIDGETRRRDIIMGESYLAGHPAAVHFGLGDHDVVPVIEVHWSDGQVTSYQNVPANRRITIHQVPGDHDRDGDVDDDDAAAFAANSGIF